MRHSHIIESFKRRNLSADELVRIIDALKYASSVLRSLSGNIAEEIKAAERLSLRAIVSSNVGVVRGLATLPLKCIGSLLILQTC